MLDKEQLRIALRLRARCEKLLAAVPARREEQQKLEDEDADVTGRQPREIKLEPLVEIPTPLLHEVLAQVEQAGVPEDIAETYKSYRRHCRFVRGLGTTNVLAHQLLAVLDAAGVKLEAAGAAAADDSAASPEKTTEETNAEV